MSDSRSTSTPSGGRQPERPVTATAPGRRVLSPRRPWVWILVAVGLLVLGAVLRDLVFALDEWEPSGDGAAGWAYVLCALLVFADGVCALFPAETTLITASALAVEGLLDLRLVILAGAVGAVTGDSALYWLARLSRRRFQARLDTMMRNAKVAEAMDLIGSSAPLLLVVGRYVPGLRFVVNASCGLAGYPYRRFIVWSSIGGSLWSVVTCLTAYVLGTALGDNPIAALVLASLVSTFAVAIIFVLIRRHRARRATSAPVPARLSSTRQPPPATDGPPTGACSMDTRRDLRLRHPRLVVAALLLVLPGCSDDGGDSSLRAAQAAVTAKEKALVDAQAATTAAEAEFCTASASYVTAIDRYGDVLRATAPTVGDVRDAGSDLAQPAKDAQKAAEETVRSRQAVTTAEQELAVAQATLTTASASAAGTTPSPAASATTPGPSPASTPAGVTAVQAAEAELEAARAGITDQTPLAEAAEQFNAAAVALEMAWLQLIGDSGCLTDAQQDEAAQAVETYTRTLQQALADAGYYEDEIDGRYGPKTVAAVQALQKANGLPQTGTLDKATERALRSELSAKGGAAAQEETASTAAVQQTLKLAGYWDGPVDGQWTDALTAALEELQEDLGVKVTGTVDAATIAAVEEAIAEATATASATPSATVSPEPTASG